MTEPGIYEAILDLMDACGNYPTTRQEIIDAVRDGVQRAVVEWLDVNGMPAIHSTE